MREATVKIGAPFTAWLKGLDDRNDGQPYKPPAWTKHTLTLRRCYRDGYTGQRFNG